MGRRKSAKEMSAVEIRDAMLRGISSEAAVMLYDSSMKLLADRGEDSYIAALQLRDACQWTEVIVGIQQDMIRAVRESVEIPTTMRAMIRNKQAAEEARRRILDGLMLIPQRQRGRPRADEDKRERETEEGDAWDDFDLPGAAEEADKGDGEE